MYIMVTESVSTAYFINLSHQPVSVCVFLLSLLGNGLVKCILPYIARQRLSKHMPTATKRRSSRRIVGRVIFSAVRALSKGVLWVCLCISLSLLGNGSVNTFSRQRGIVVGVIFYVVQVVWKESRVSVLHRTSSSFFFCILSVTNTYQAIAL
jgi:hypothetical protein